MKEATKSAFQELLYSSTEFNGSYPRYFRSTRDNENENWIP